jgi:TM2 domain-containing membrane protein YozV
MGEFGDEGPHNKGTAFLLWLACVFGFAGIHRFYLGRPWTGALWFFTFGLFGVGQLVDLFRIPVLVAEENQRFALRTGARPMLNPAPSAPAKPPEDIEVQLTRAAAEHAGKLSVTQAVLATGRPFKEVEATLDAMLRAGYVGIDNDIDTGAVIYTFGDLAR